MQRRHDVERSTRGNGQALRNDLLSNVGPTGETGEDEVAGRPTNDKDIVRQGKAL
jgi:hypothetical protein